MEFTRIDYPKYQSASIIIKGAFFKVKNADIGEAQKGKYDTDTVPIVLTQKQAGRAKDIQEEVNEYLGRHGLDKITIVYGNKIYPKVEKGIKVKPRGVKLLSIFIKGAKQYPQLYVMS
jgi:hypothetical protein